MSVSDNLRQLRTQNNYSRKEVAAAIGVSLETYRRYEKGERNTPPARRKMLAAFYKVSLKEIERGITSVESKTTATKTLPELCKKVLDAESNGGIKKDLVVDLVHVGVEWLRR